MVPFPNKPKDGIIPLQQWVTADLERMVRRGLDTSGNIQWLRSEIGKVQTHMLQEFIQTTSNLVMHHNMYVQLSCPALDHVVQAAVLSGDEILLPLEDFWGEKRNFNASYKDRDFFINYYGVQTRIKIDGVTHLIKASQCRETGHRTTDRLNLPHFMKGMMGLKTYETMGYEITQMFLNDFTTTCMRLYSPHPIEEFAWRMEKVIEDGGLVRKLNRGIQLVH